ncbi:MAG: GntP family permease [Planctomycetia bacterium]|nr:GntP family permease [Planctomycetia bacterium]
MSQLLYDPIVILTASLFVVIGAITILRLGAFFSLILGALTVRLWSSFISGNEVNLTSDLTSVCEALGTTVGNVGLLIVLGTAIGKFMTDNGSADRIVLFFRNLFGAKRLPAALASGAFLLSIPVFYDATFYLLLPLAKSAYRATRSRYVCYLLAVGLGATISHTIIPPTPGPIAVATTLDVPISTALGIGVMVGACLFPVALLLAWALDKIMPNPKIDPSALQEESQDYSTAPDAPNVATYPSLLASFAPILLPAILIAVASLTKSALSQADVSSRWLEWLQVLYFLGNVNVALFLGAVTAYLTTLFSRTRGATRSVMEQKLNTILTGAGAIILITASGGAYGAMLRESGIGERISELFALGDGSASLTVLTLAFFLTALLKSAQGSSTTAMITSASIFATLNLTSSTLHCSMGYLTAAIGSGSCVASWMNDSGFCVFSRSTGISELDSLKVWTVGTGLLGFCGYFVILILSRLVPLV